MVERLPERTSSYIKCDEISCNNLLLFATATQYVVIISIITFSLSF